MTVRITLLILFSNVSKHCFLCGKKRIFLSTKDVNFNGRAMSQGVSRQSLTAEARVRSQVGPCQIWCGQSSSVTGFSPSTSVSPVSTIPPTLHTHSLIYHQRCIMFFSQYFSFPCQYHFTNAPYTFIDLPPTLYNVFLPVLQFPPSVSFHQCSILIHSSTTDAV